MKTPEQIIQAYAMGLLMPGEVASQMKDHYPGLNPVQIMTTVNTVLLRTNEDVDLDWFWRD